MPRHLSVPEPLVEMQKTQQSEVDVPVDIPIYNQARELPCATERALGQIWLALEIFTEDDGSGHVAKTEVSGPSGPNRLLKQEDRGVSQARSRGMAMADGSLIASVDAHDHWHPGKLGLQLAAMGVGPGAGWCATALSMEDNAERPLPGRAGGVSRFREMGMQTGEWSCARATGVTLSEPTIPIFLDDAGAGP